MLTSGLWSCVKAEASARACTDLLVSSESSWHMGSSGRSCADMPVTACCIGTAQPKGAISCATATPTPGSTHAATGNFFRLHTNFVICACSDYPPIIFYMVAIQCIKVANVAGTTAQLVFSAQFPMLFPFFFL